LDTSVSKIMKDQEQHRLTFLRALEPIRIPDYMHIGVSVQEVAANGSTRSAKLRLSADKFTFTITSTATTSRGLFSKPSATHTRDVDIGEIERIQRGQSTHHFEKAKKKVSKGDLIRHSSTSSQTTGSVTSAWHKLDPGRSFSIIFRGAQTLDIMAEDECLRDQICTLLDSLLDAYQVAKVKVAREVLLLRYSWIANHKNNRLSVTQFGKVLQEINFVMKPKELNSAFDYFGKVISLDRKERRIGLTFEMSATFLHKIKRDSWMVKPLQVLWNELFGEFMNNGKMRQTVSDKTFLDKFLKGKQGDVQATVQDVRKIFKRLHNLEIALTSSETVDASRITKDHFEAFLYAAENDAFDPDKERFEVSDMEQPLSEYWINSSHNTYLIGDQYTSNSSVEMYSKALYRGCRCLELDVWDGAKNDNAPVPVVWHGHTITSKILFVDIIKTIKVFLNFHPDTLPIILSFENHCSIPYQEVMAEQLTRIFGSTLYIPKDSSLSGPLPSPESLRGMVIIKGRRPVGTEDGYDTETDEEISDDDEESNISQAVRLNEIAEKRRQLQKKHGIAPQLARLTLLHGHKLKSFAESIRAPTFHMHSFSENKVRSNSRGKNAPQWVLHNQTHMSRTYPAGARVDSSNYNPLLAWSVGCQMVALNFQTQDHFLRLNDGRFRENGGCGYVLKPSVLMMKEKLTEPSAALRLSIRVLSGSCLPKPKGRRTGDCIDPYVKVAVYDVANSEREKKETISFHQTDAVLQNGFFPIWSQEKFKFTVYNWSAAMLQLTVHDKTRDEFIASASIPISCLRGGIRSVKLYDSTNTRSGAIDFASLLLDIKIGQAVAEI